MLHLLPSRAQHGLIMVELGRRLEEQSKNRGEEKRINAAKFLTTSKLAYTAVYYMNVHVHLKLTTDSYKLMAANPG